MPCLLFLSGGPGFSAPRPHDASSWLKSATSVFRVILMDQRGTGKSNPITVNNLSRRGGPAEQAKYLSFFRADNIVKDAEVVRKTLVAADSYGGRWSIIGQSFGGFCCATYLSFAPNSLIEVLMTGGIPPGILEPCAAETVYRRLYKRVALQNARYYERFPGDVALVQRIVNWLAAQPMGGYETPSGSLLTPRALQLLGLGGMGMGGGFERLHFTLETFFDSEGDITPCFLKSFDQQMPWDSNPLYAMLHESIYCQGAASSWAAHRVRQLDEFRPAFDAVDAASSGRPVLFTGEMVFPWMFDDFACLRPYKAAAELIAQKSDWGKLYDADVLACNNVPAAAAVYFEDMYVDCELSQATAARIRGLRQWVTSEYKHSGIRDDGGRIFDRLINMVRDQILLD
ncbi:hypothetical protein FOA52_003438 [Chlamydomonas sp. UWO 241]|nr:hypothetical protein FOA52_003438 [Chlamydomonas sp. UWO 241]